MAERFKLSTKYKDFLRYRGATVEILEGTTAAGKTTVGAVKFIMMVAESDKKQHIISAKDLGVAEKNIINSEVGLIDVFGQNIEYNPKGRGKDTMAHIIVHSNTGDKIVYVIGYDTASRWKSILGSQFGCVYIDEINTADMAYVSQAVMRCDYLMGTLNPDDPDKEIYTQYINRCRPVEEYKDDAPAELLEELDQPHEPGWAWWYFDFDDNAGLSEKKKAQIKRSKTPGTSDYRHYILGLRGKAEGVIFDNFDSKRHIMTEQEAITIANNSEKTGEKFIQFTSGLDTSFSRKSDDSIAFSFLGITNKHRCIVLDELVLNNKGRTVANSITSDEIPAIYYEFLEKNRKKYGFSLYNYVDCADSGTINVLGKERIRKGWTYNFAGSWKTAKICPTIIDRITYQKTWMASGHFMIVESCRNYIHELQVYSWSDKNSTNKQKPEDGNDHMINSVQYAFIPYIPKIG